MIDTIVLTFKKPEFRIIDYSRFNATLEDIERWYGMRRWPNNPTKEQKESGKYYPKLTLIRRIADLTLRVEFSAPKLLFDNNLDEVEENDFARLAALLRVRVRDMGVLLSEQRMPYVNVSAFHASKNVVLTGGYTASSVIKELGKINLHAKLDLDYKNYRNDGETLQYHSKAHAVVIYDKIRDLGKRVRKIDRDLPFVQQKLFYSIKKTAPHLEILRIEIRLANRQKIKDVLKELRLLHPLTLKYIFKEILYQKVLKLYWSKMITEHNMFIFDSNTNPQTIFRQLLEVNPPIKIKRTLYLLGLNIICREAGIRALRSMIAERRPKTNWQAISRDMRDFDAPIFQQHPHGYIQDIQQALDEFKPYKRPQETDADKQLAL